MGEIDWSLYDFPEHELRYGEKVLRVGARVMFPYGNTTKFDQDFMFGLRGVPGGTYFEIASAYEREGRLSVTLRALGYGVLCHDDIEGFSPYGSGALHMSVAPKRPTPPGAA